MDATLVRMAHEAGLSDVTDLRRHDVRPALELFVQSMCFELPIRD